MDTADDFVSRVKAGHMTNTMALQKYSSTLLSKEQARTNVVREIVNAEKEYVKHLKDVVEVSLKHPELLLFIYFIYMFNITQFTMFKLRTVKHYTMFI